MGKTEHVEFTFYFPLTFLFEIGMNFTLSVEIRLLTFLD